MDTRPVGIFGGTFDPVHYGHLRLAEEMREQAGLAQIRFIPSGRPPHRRTPGASPLQRSEMVRLAIAGHPDFVLDTCEVVRTTPCYTVETLRALRAEFGPQRALCLMLGGDAFLQLTTWHAWTEVLALAHIVVADRPGYSLAAHLQHAPAVLREVYAQCQGDTASLQAAPAGRIVEQVIPMLDISATDIRRRVAARGSIRYLLPEAVAGYIYQHHLYGTC